VSSASRWGGLIVLRFFIPVLIVLSFFASLGFAYVPASDTTTSLDTSFGVARCHRTMTGSANGVEFTITIYEANCRHKPVASPQPVEEVTFLDESGTPCHGYTKVWIIIGWVKYTWYAPDCPHKPKKKAAQALTLEQEIEQEIGLFVTPPPPAPFATVANVVTDTREPWRPCGDEPASAHCICVKVTWLCGGEEHTVTYQLCSACDVQALKSIILQAAAFGCTLISREVVACQ
jgi:hypothetical protein